MKYETEINGQTVSLELEEKDGRVSAIIDGRLYELEVIRPEAGVYQLLVGDKVYEARVSASESKALNINLRGKLFVDEGPKHPCIALR